MYKFLCQLKILLMKHGAEIGYNPNSNYIEIKLLGMENLAIYEITPESLEKTIQLLQDK
jgi:hypothetical protein